MSILLAILVVLFSVAAALVPTVLYVLTIWWIDRYEKEPLRLLAVAFLWGAFPAVIVSALVEIAFHAPIVAFSEQYSRLISVSLIAPPVEEGIKGLALLGLFLLARREFDDALDGIIYGSLIGFGFAMTENITYFLSAWYRGGLASWRLIIVVRSVAFGLNHAMFTALTGIGFGLARYERSRGRRIMWIMGGLAAAMIAHFTHNFFVSLGSTCVLSFLADWMGVLVVAVIIILAWRRERAWMVMELAEEVLGGVLTQVQYDAIISRRSRWSRQWRLLGEAGISRARLWGALVSAATELAFKKHQHAVMGDERGNGAAIAALRERIVQLRTSLGE